MKFGSDTGRTTSAFRLANVTPYRLQYWQEPPFVSLWRSTREWSLADFRRIFAELGATFDVWFFESEVEEEGRQIVKILLDEGIAEMSEGMPVVKIDEKLGITEPTYRTLPILVLALAVRHLALGAAPVTGSVLLVGQGVTDAARSLGDDALRMVLRVGVAAGPDVSNW